MCVCVAAQVGEALAFKGPIMKYPYSANTKKEIGMIAGGREPGAAAGGVGWCALPNPNP